MLSLASELLADLRKTADAVRSDGPGSSDAAPSSCRAEALRILMLEARSLLLTPMIERHAVAALTHDPVIDALPTLLSNATTKLLDDLASRPQLTVSHDAAHLLLAHSEALMTSAMCFAQTRLDRQACDPEATDPSELAFGSTLQYVVVLDLVSAATDSLRAVVAAMVATADGDASVDDGEEQNEDRVPTLAALEAIVAQLCATLLVLMGFVDASRVLRGWQRDASPLPCQPPDAQHVNEISIATDAKAAELVVGTMVSSGALAELAKLVLRTVAAAGASPLTDVARTALDFMSSLALSATGSAAVPLFDAGLTVETLISAIARPRLAASAAKLLTAVIARDTVRPGSLTANATHQQKAPMSAINDDVPVWGEPAVLQFATCKGVSACTSAIGHLLSHPSFATATHTQPQGVPGRGASVASNGTQGSRNGGGPGAASSFVSATATLRDIVPSAIAWIAAPLCAAASLQPGDEACRDALLEMSLCFSFKQTIQPSGKLNAILSSGLGTLHSAIVAFATSAASGAQGGAVADELRIVGADVLVLSQLVDVNPATRRHFSSEKTNVLTSWAVLLKEGAPQPHQRQQLQQPAAPAAAPALASRSGLEHRSVSEVAAATTPAVDERHAAVMSASAALCSATSAFGATVALVKRTNSAAFAHSTTILNTRAPRTAITRRYLAAAVAPAGGHPFSLRPSQCIVFESASPSETPIEITVVEERPPNGPTVPPVASTCPAWAVIAAATSAEAMRMQRRVPQEAAVAGKFLGAGGAAPSAFPLSSGSPRRELGAGSPRSRSANPDVSRSRRSASPQFGSGATSTRKHGAQPSHSTVGATVADPSVQEELIRTQQRLRDVTAQRDELMTKVHDMRSELDITQEEIVAPLQEELRALRLEAAAARRDARVALEALAVLERENATQADVIEEQCAALKRLARLAELSEL